MEFTDIIRTITVSVIPLVIAITFHEVAHGWAAYRMGDPTAKALGRLTLNPIAHIDPIGTVVMPLVLLAVTGGSFVFGYAKPVPINPMNFRDPRKGFALSAAAGPGMNIALALASVLVAQYVLFPMEHLLPAAVFVPLGLMLRASVHVNVILAALNLLPVPPLDGGRVVAGILPHDLATKYEGLERYGMFIVILLLVSGLARVFITPLANLIYRFLEIFIN